jgi:hypothetical protein
MLAIRASRMVNVNRTITINVHHSAGYAIVVIHRTRMAVMSAGNRLRIGLHWYAITMRQAATDHRVRGEGDESQHSDCEKHEAPAFAS